MEEIEAIEFLIGLTQSRRRLHSDEMQVLYALAQHASPSIRAETAALLLDHYEEKSEQVLLRLAQDSFSSVRVNAVDSLCIGRTEATASCLLHHAAHDPAAMVRGCAVRSLYDVFLNRFGDSDQTMQRIAALLEPLLMRETQLWVCTCYYCILYLCGKREYMQLLAACLEDADDAVRGNVLDAFNSILDDQNAEEIEAALQSALELEEKETLINRIADLLALLHDMGEDGRTGRGRFAW